MPRPETNTRKLERALRAAPEKQLKVAAIWALGIKDVGKTVKELERKGGLRLERDGDSWSDPDAAVTLLGRKGRTTSAASEPRVPKRERKTRSIGVFDYTGTKLVRTTRDIKRGFIFEPAEYDWIHAFAVPQYYCRGCGQPRLEPTICPRCSGTEIGRIDLLPSVEDAWPAFPFPTEAEPQAAIA